MQDEPLRRRIGRLGTVRSRLTLLATVLVAATLVISAVVLVLVDQGLLTRAVDEALVQRTDNLEVDVARGTIGAVLPGEGDVEDSFEQVVGSDGVVIAATANIASLPAMSSPLALNSDEQVRTISAPSVSSHEFRILARSVGSAYGTRTLVVAKNIDDASESVGILMTSLALSIPVVVSLLAAVVWWLMGRALAPVEAIRAEVSSIRGSELHRRVPVRANNDEISSLARTMNGLLERVQHATERQRQFVADASHELRSPLTRIRSVLEVSIAHPDTTEPDDTYRSVLSEAIQLQQLVDDLLFLARSESGLVERPDVAVDLDDLVVEQTRQLRARAHVRVNARGVSAARVRGDIHQLRRAISNLASNAERHAKTTVTFELYESDGRSELVVADDGPGIPDDQREAVFRRFTRLDDARSRDSGGAGLGLAIVSDIVTRHSGTVTIAASDAGGTRVIVSLPRAD